MAALRLGLSATAGAASPRASPQSSPASHPVFHTSVGNTVICRLSLPASGGSQLHDTWCSSMRRVIRSDVGEPTNARSYMYINFCLPTITGG